MPRCSRTRRGVGSRCPKSRECGPPARELFCPCDRFSNATEQRMPNVAIVTGAGSGVGRAVALRLLREGWNVAIVSRRAEALNETVRAAQEASRARAHPFPCDVADAKAVADVVAEVARRFGGIHALVNSAGTNLPNRGMDVLSVDDFHALIDVNLNGTFHCVHAVLPYMRRQGEGTIV